MRFNLW